MTERPSTGSPFPRPSWYAVTSSAAPSALPIRWPVWITAPAAPPIRGGTALSDRVWLGEMTAPPPNPASSSGNASMYQRNWSASAGSTSHSTTRPDIITAMAITVIFRFSRATSRPAMGDITAVPRANGVTSNPACSGV